MAIELPDGHICRNLPDQVMTNKRNIEMLATYDYSHRIYVEGDMLVIEAIVEE